MSQILIEQEQDWRKLRHAQHITGLGYEDLKDHPAVLETLMQSDGNNFEAFMNLFKANTLLCRKAVLNGFASSGVRINLRDPEMVLEVEELVEVIRTGLGSTIETVRSLFSDNSDLSMVDTVDERTIPQYRDKALGHMIDNYGHVDLGSDSSFALSDLEMARYFKAGGETVNQKYLGTYFDSAFEGLVNVRLQQEVDRIGHSKRGGIQSFVANMKRIIIEALEHGDASLPDRRFFPDNIFFQMNGTEAFLLFARTFMQKGHKLLAGSEEYHEMLTKIEDGIQVDQLSQCDSEAVYLEELEKALNNDKPDFLLVSEVSRFGNPHHLEAINEIRRKASAGTKLVVDACQSAGRYLHDMKACEADVVLLSVGKGSDLGKGLGLFTIAGAMPIKKINDLNGSSPPDLLARTACALDPEKFDKKYNLAVDEDVRRLILAPEERGQAVKLLTQKFLKLIQAINSNHDGRIEIINPISFDNAAHVVEIKIKGISREDLQANLATHGIYVNPESYKTEDDDESVRIAFHPFMKNEALLTLCGALVNTFQSESL